MRTVTAFAVLVIAIGLVALVPARAMAQACERTISADVVAIDQPFFWNRLGAAQPHGMIYALKRDVVQISGDQPGPGNAKLRSDKRPRPIVLRMNVGDCLAISFTNWLANPRVQNEQPATRAASVHVVGLQLVGGIGSDGYNAGQNASSLAMPGQTRTYTYYAQRENTYFLHSGGALAGGDGDGGSIPAGLFGAVNVEPRGAEWYRSQVTADDLERATVGTLPSGHPQIDYGAVYADGHPLAGRKILAMLQGNEIVHSDLNAVITGPGRGQFSAGTYPPNAVYPNRNQPFREFTVIFHDEIGAVQAFPLFNDPVFKHTLHSVRDGFAINYGAGGAGAEIVANRVGVGPMWECVECKYEEFFLTSWAVGDPAMVVDVPANATLAAGGPAAGVRATKALYADDPSNVHHSYLNDHVKFRNVHAGPKEHHIFHLHAHQWLRTPDSDNSTYLDSQHIGPGSGFTYEIAYNGSGNRNKTAGDSIFHCHFYPHFAQGMWELWRVHDVFEAGTVLDAEGRPAPGSRALPDAEILVGTPIPALVPLPTLAMAPLPPATAEIEWVEVTDPATGQTTQQPTGQVKITGAGNPGYPFFIAGVAGHRPPHPPMDTLVDGGLPRHVILGGTAHVTVDRLDFSKELLTATAVKVPEEGTPTEQAAMAFHSVLFHQTATPEGAAANFETNGLPPQPGAPYADPCRTDAGQPFGAPRHYKGASMQLDMKLNKAGWHFPQSRINILLNDVEPTQAGQRPPEPLFFRANTNDCITYEHSNFIPFVYEQDDFQVRTPTDIIGQHIHLVKFDVMAADGSGNGWNYEDGTFSPGEVLERIGAINLGGGLLPFGGGEPITLAPQPGPLGVLGAQTTVQRWFADPTLNLAGKDRTLRTVFTHDHYGPSTHQQVGLTSSLVIEPEGSTWRNPETGAILGTREDGGPTSWRADILTQNAADSYREFMFQFGDFQLAYRPDGTAVNPPGRKEIGLPFLLGLMPECPGGVPRPCPEAISAEDPGTFMVNYRHEPLALRVRDPNTNTQALGDAGDLANAFRSDVIRADAAFNTQPDFYPPLTAGVQPGDPFTPLLRAYENDKVQIRIQVGQTEESHNINVHGVKWLYEPSEANSGWRNSQAIGISEHFEFVLPALSAVKGEVPFADYLYEVGSSTDNRWNGTWGLMRAYNGGLGIRPDLLTLPNNPTGKSPNVKNPKDFSGFCPATAPIRNFNVTAVTAQKALSGRTLVYNPRQNQGGQLHDPTAMLYVLSQDLNTKGTLKAGVPVEPLILRAKAGDCIQITLTNRLGAVLSDLAGFNMLPMIVENFNNNQIAPSSQVGLHPQLVAYDILDDDGANVGFNPVQTAGPGQIKKYKWYAGDITVCQGGKPADRCGGKPDGSMVATPVEFGAINLSPADPLKHSGKGLVAALVIEPQGATWVEDAGSRASATVTKADGSKFREFVVVFQNDLNLRFADGSAVPNLGGSDDSEDSGQKAFNYRTEPFWKRLGYAPTTPENLTRNVDFSNALSNEQVGGDPVTPVFTAKPGEAVRFRVLHPGGHQRNHVFAVSGHAWQEEPYTNGSSVIGNNALSQWTGVQQGHGATNHFDAVLQNGAGGAFGVTGDYVYRDQASFQFGGGLWGIFRVAP